MDFSVIVLDEATDAFRSELEAWLDEHVTEAMLDAEWSAGDGHDPVFHRALGAEGWAFASLTENGEERDHDPLARQIFELELARRHVPSTVRSTTAIVLPAVQRWMQGSRRADILRGVARGDICFCLGYTEPETGSDLAAVRTMAVRHGDEWVINGQKMFTTGAHVSQFCFLLARTDREAPKHKGLTTFLVPLDAPGIEVRAVETLGGERTNMVFLDDVRIHDEYRLGPQGHGWVVVHGPLDVEHQMGEGPLPIEEWPGESGMGSSIDMSGHILGVYEAALRAAVEWARTPGSAGRRPIDDPVVRQRLAEVELGLVVSRMTPGAQGRVLAADLLIRSSAELVDLIGPPALVTRDEPGCVGEGWVEYAHRYAQACATYGGTTEVMRNVIGDRFLALGRRPQN